MAVRVRSAGARGIPGSDCAPASTRAGITHVGIVAGADHGENGSSGRAGGVAALVAGRPRRGSVGSGTSTSPASNRRSDHPTPVYARRRRSTERTEIVIEPEYLSILHERGTS